MALYKSALLSIIITSLGIVFLLPPLQESILQSELELMFKLRGPIEPPDEIVIISLEKTSTDYLQELSDLHRENREKYIHLLEALNNINPELIAFDVFFAKPRNSSSDAKFAEVIDNSDRILLSQKLHRDQVFDVLQNPLGKFANSSTALAPFPLPKIPVKVNYFWAFLNVASNSEENPSTICHASIGEKATSQHSENLEYGLVTKSIYPIASMPVASLLVIAIESLDDGKFINILKTANPKQFSSLPDSVDSASDFCELSTTLRLALNKNNLLLEKLNELTKTLPTNQLLHNIFKIYAGEKTSYLNYYGPHKTISTSYYEELFDSDNKVIFNQIKKLKNKIIFIGGVDNSATDQIDSFPSVYTSKQGFELSGVEIAATATANLLLDQSIKLLPVNQQILIIVLFGTLISMAALFFAGYWSVITCLLISLIYLLNGYNHFTEDHQLIPIAIPLFVQLSSVIVISQTYKYLFYRKSLQQYLPNRATTRLDRKLSNVGNDEFINAICLTSDIANYTTLAENVSTQELVTVKNTYFSILSKIAEEYSGEIISTFGDSFTAVWPNPTEKSFPKQNACQAAVKMQREINNLNRTEKNNKFQTRIGLNEGNVALGNIGGSGHYTYSVSGDAINTASRIEALNKTLGTNILASDKVIENIDLIHFRRLGTFRLKGKQTNITAYQVLDWEDTKETNKQNFYLEFNLGLKAFERADWNLALQKFKKSSSMNTNDGPSNFYKSLTNNYINKPNAYEIKLPIIINYK